MAYITYEDYVSIYGNDRLKQDGSKRLLIDANRLLDLYTTGVDNVRKLKIAFPTDEDDAEIVKACGCKITDLLWQIDEAEKASQTARGYTETANGLQGKVVSSVSAGNESISYSSSSGDETAITKAISSLEDRTKLIDGIIRKYLSGITDANGVNLMYMGKYPEIRR